MPIGGISDALADLFGLIKTHMRLLNIRILDSFRTLVTLVGALIILTFAQGAYGLVLSADVAQVNLVPQTEVLVDAKGQLTLEEILAHPESYVFKREMNQQAREFSFGFTQAAYWLRFDLSRTSEATPRWILEIPFVGIDNIQWYPPGGQMTVSGTTSGLDGRQIMTRSHAFYVDIGLEKKTYYMRVQSSYHLTLPLILMRTDTFGRKQLIDTMVQSLYYGGLLSLFLYNLVIFFTYRDRRYLLYCIFTAAAGLAMYAGNGYGRLFLWPNFPGFDRISQGFFVGIATGLAFLFSCAFLDLRNRSKIIYWILLGATAVSLTVSLGLLLSMTIPMSLSWLYTSQFLTSSFGMITCISVAIYLATKGVREAKYFILSWGFLCVGAIAATLRAFDFLPNNLFTLYAVQISSGFEALFFSFALADRLRSERQAREQAQLQLLVSQQETVEALKISEEKLAKAVNIRTQELRAIVIREQQVREQYVRFGAMIAHEFRNPLNVIETQNTLLELGAETGVIKVQQRVNVIRSAVDRLSTMFDQWLQSDRLNQEFAKISPLPIDATSLLKDVEKSSRSYHCDHVFICSYPDRPTVIQADYALLRIAILNLIDNACKYSSKGKEITLGATLENGWVGIYVSDQGIGIPPDKLNTIFEPYVRLEAEERLVGAGLGLSFVKRIVDLHDAKIDAKSQVGHGSTFTIWIKLESLPSSMH